MAGEQNGLFTIAGEQQGFFIMAGEHKGFLLLRSNTKIVYYCGRTKDFFLLRSNTHRIFSMAVDGHDFSLHRVNNKGLYDYWRTKIVLLYSTRPQRWHTIKAE